jgi:hypothetical protein
VEVGSLQQATNGKPMNGASDGKIVVLGKYTSAIEANVAKTKLDAYGIPCFLSNENISGLYPLPYMKGFEVALHVFEDDCSQALEVLQKEEG